MIEIPFRSGQSGDDILSLYEADFGEEKVGKEGGRKIGNKAAVLGKERGFLDFRR